jgi:hypothetical protein
MVKKSHAFFKEGANLKKKKIRRGFFFKGTLMKRTVLKRKEQKEHAHHLQPSFLLQLL